MGNGYKHVMVLVDSDLYARLRRYAFESNTSISDVVRKSVRKTIDGESIPGVKTDGR